MGSQIKERGMMGGLLLKKGFEVGVVCQFFKESGVEQGGLNPFKTLFAGGHFDPFPKFG